VDVKEREDNATAVEEHEDQSPGLGEIDLAAERHGDNEYPLRKPEEDQRWAVNTVRIWLAILSFLFIGISLLLVLGAIYD